MPLRETGTGCCGKSWGARLVCSALEMPMGTEVKVTGQGSLVSRTSWSCELENKAAIDPHIHHMESHPVSGVYLEGLVSPQAWCSYFVIFSPINVAFIQLPSVLKIVMISKTTNIHGRS